MILPEGEGCGQERNRVSAPARRFFNESMKTKLHSLFIGLALLAGVHHATAQEARFFRISGPAPTAIIAINPDGTLVWSNALAGTTYTVQTVTENLPYLRPVSRATKPASAQHAARKRCFRIKKINQSDEPI